MVIRTCFLQLFLGICLFSCEKQKRPIIIEVNPVFEVGQPDPTNDKPQSKIWYSKAAWWALLPDKKGPSLWKRTSNEWTSEPVLSEEFLGQPGKADVYANKGIAMAVLVENCQIKVLKLRSNNKSVYKQEDVITLKTPKSCLSIETATITCDTNGVWWVASDMNNQVLVWSSIDDGKTWSSPIVLAENISDDDICIVSKLKNTVSVIWSNQNNESIVERIHHNDKDLSSWSSEISISNGEKTADDHLNTTVLSDNTLVLVSKNSLDQLDRPQFVLRIRRPSGEWLNIPYCNLTKTESPTRPVVTHLPNGKLVTLHTVASPNHSSYISISTINVDGNKSKVTEKFRVIAKNRIEMNNVTVSKSDFYNCTQGPWIVLFSNKLGQVFEIDLYRYKDLL
ncbi:hypothetical protein [Algibacter pacificus]|uniref:hypothetical protein n=1 Tax=Algibacter pacificus TaxID=2599389 RepID=UPI0011C99675|nr:hypothetical protein [Algibacter pacificus]